MINVDAELKMEEPNPNILPVTVSSGFAVLVLAAARPLFSGCGF